MKASNNREASEPVSLPLLPLLDHVLLPGGFVRVLIPPAWRKSAALVQHLLQQQGGAVYVAAVPYMAGKAPEEGDLQEEEHLDLERLHHTGTAARVLQLLKRTQSGGWTVTLEGRCRVRVNDVSLSPLTEVLVASVEQLDYFGAAPSPFGPSSAAGAAPLAAKGHLVKGGPSGLGRRGGGGPAAEEGGPATKQQEELVQELLQGTRQLFMLLQGGPEGRESGARVTQMLQPQGPARVADVLGALVARDSKDRLALLSTIDVTRRLELARELMSKMLLAAARVVGAAGGAGAGRGLVPSGAGGTQARRAGMPFRISDLGGGGGGEEGEEGDSKEELKALLKKLQDSNPPPEVLRVALREYKRLARGSEQHPGHAMSLAYLETLAELPWSRWSYELQQQEGGQGREEGAQGQGAGEQRQQGEEGEEAGGRGEGLAGAGEGEGERAASEESGGEGAGGRGAAGGGEGGELSLKEVRERLDAAHYGLDKIKERIVQYVAVQRLRGWDARAPILCFIGPPGVGKTSLARCVGEVLGRPMQRISLGGVRDEAEIRGHRRTYIGAMPGRVIQAVRRAGVRDPVLLLDEVDKMGRDARGDPAAALLEVLDPEQNHAFTDTYLGVPFDLSAVVFLSTANRASDIPAPLLDRMEVVNLAGYTMDEKVHIAQRHLVPRALREHGLLPGQLAFPPEALALLVEGYTREAGVRTLARCLAAVCRHVAVQVVSQREEGGPSAAAAGTATGVVLSTGTGPLVIEEAAAAGNPWGGGPEGRLLHLRSGPTGLALHARAAQQQQQQQMAARAGLGAVVAGRAGLGGPVAALSFATQPAGDRGSVQLWRLLSGLELPPAQQARRGSKGRRGGKVAAVAPAPVLAGYPWARLGPLLQRHSPPGSPRGQHSDGGQHQAGAGGGGWFSWLSVLPWGAAGRHLAERHAEVEEERFEQHAQHGQHAQQDNIGVSGAANVWGPDAAFGGEHPPDGHSAADRSMSLAGSMHSMACNRWRCAEGNGSTRAALAVLPAGAPSSVLHLQPAGEGEGWALVAPGLGRGLAGTAEEGSSLQVAQQLQMLPQQGEARCNPLRQVVVDETLIEEVLGPRRFTGHDNSERVASPGTAAGLVWTAVGGQVQYIECLCVGASRGEGNGSLTLTGQLGDVLEESARIALSWVRAHAAALGLPGGPSCPAATWDVHIHLPAGAVPKDGPSAGVTLATALVSLFMGRCVRADTAMTGELTLRGLVLPVGGMKEKLLAAHTAGMSRVIVPARNMRDVQADVPQEVRQALEVLPAERLEDVLRNAFDPPLDLQPRAKL